VAELSAAAGGIALHRVLMLMGYTAPYKFVALGEVAEAMLKGSVPAWQSGTVALCKVARATNEGAGPVDAVERVAWAAVVAAGQDGLAWVARWMARLCVWLGYVYGSADGSARWTARLGGWLGLVDGSAR